MGSFPDSVMRLFPGYRRQQLERPEHRAFLVGRLLEEGDSADLRWLISDLGEDVLGSWLRQGGYRSLSRRSQAFWAAVLRVDLPNRPQQGLWPL